MASKNYRPKQAVVTKNTPSIFGSHAAMINTKAMAKVEELGLPTTREVTIGNTTTTKEFVILTDDYGDYVTDKDRLDTKSADPNRYDLFQINSGTTSISASNFEKRQSLVTAIIGLPETETQD
jgi:hypothetical protein|tara:strand:+ start:9993 stop:10361 length:369 start_codon:yes stop_codon:yes gene_type:complete